MTVAVVMDDNLEELQSLLSILRSTGQFEGVYGFDCPSEACRLIQERGCDILFVASEIKGMNCFVLIDSMRKIKQDIFYVIMASGEGYALEAFQKEIMHYVLKPLTPEAVSRTLEKLKKYNWRNKHS